MYTAEHLSEESRGGKGGTDPFEIIAEHGDFVRAFQVESKPDLLSEILKPKIGPATLGSR
ncbi:MAG: hypothetical protein ACM3NF_01730 [Gemmatimonadota bacterium]